MLLCTSRPAGLAEALFSRFHRLRLAPLSDAQQEAFLKAMSGGLASNWSGPGQEEGSEAKSGKDDDLDTIKKQLAELQSKLNKMS